MGFGTMSKKAAPRVPLRRGQQGSSDQLRGVLNGDRTFIRGWNSGVVAQRAAGKALIVLDGDLGPARRWSASVPSLRA